MSFSFDSVVDSAGYQTRLVIDPAASALQSIQLIRGGNKVFEFPTLAASFCTIQFQRYDLEANALVKKDADGNYKVQDIINYTPQNAIVSGNSLRYDAVQALPYIGTGIEPKSFDAIKVEISFSAAAQNADDSGWINVDVAFTFPSQFANAAYTNKHAWQINLIFPQIQFDVSAQASAMADNAYIKDWSLLLPHGDIGKIDSIPKDPLQVQDMPVQYAALYRATDSYVRGVALSATDVLGGEKAFIYARSVSQTPATDSFQCYTVFPMHLSSGRYVRPSLPNSQQFHFRLSQGDENGFGGGRMHYRVKAFHVDKTTASAAMDWRDVANIYRKWVKTNRPLWFDKANARAKTGPMDNMSPFTVITNYGLDGPIDPSVFDTNLPSKWLEIHPIKVDGKTDMPASRTQPVNNNESLQDMLKRIRQKVNAPDVDVRLEAQIWGYEPGGYYHYIGGYPPITNLLHAPTAATPNRFKKAMDELVKLKIIPIFTSDLMRQLFNGGRYRGHIIRADTNWANINNKESWNEAISHPFPDAYTNPARNPNPCKFRVATKYYPDPANRNVVKNLTRVFIIKQFVNAQGQDFFDPQPNCPEAETLAESQIYDERGLLISSGLLSNPIYERARRTICPTKDVLDYYLNTQLSNGALKSGARLIEFMKPGYRGCYYKGHKHIFGDLSSYPYKNVIGYGSHATARRQQIFTEIQERARVNNPSFALSHEGVTLEPLLPFYDEFYHSSPVFHFVYSEVVSVKMTLINVEPYIHPGYTEKRKPINGKEPKTLALPDYMLRAEAEDEVAPPDLVILPDPATMPAPNEPRTNSFNAWRNICVNYFKDYFQVAQYGLAPKSYPTRPSVQGATAVAWKEDDPLAPTDPPNYTYIRCVQDLFNLRYWVYLTGEKAVVGERVYLHANWFELPLDCNDEAVKMAVRSTQLQMRFANFFRGGVMLGKTIITSGNKPLWAWKASYRYFDDVKPLNEKVPGTKLLDFISLGTDKEYIDKDRIFATVIRYDKIQHMVWRTGSGDSRKVLYVFANVGNAQADVRFNYSRGLEGISENQAIPSGWEKVITRYTGEGIKQSTGPVWLNQEENMLVMPQRTVAGIEIIKINHAQFVAQTVPKSMKANQQYKITIRMKNIGTSTWTAAAQYKLGSQNPQDNQIWGTNRVLSGAGSVAPGKEKTFQFTVKAPAARGTYNFQWRMVRELVEWFGDTTPNVSVTVV
jgi:hypothetical protein